MILYLQMHLRKITRLILDVVLYSASLPVPEENLEVTMQMQIRKMMDKNEVCFQTAELGKVDVGGGGTIAYILSLYGMEVIDCGVAVLNMHAPWEITSKADIYEAYKCYKVFLKEA